jgi:hypothetical protein
MWHGNPRWEEFRIRLVERWTDLGIVIPDDPDVAPAVPTCAAIHRACSGKPEMTSYLLWKMSPGEMKESLAYLAEWGGRCDCTVLINVAIRSFEAGDTPESATSRGFKPITHDGFAELIATAIGGHDIESAFNTISALVQQYCSGNLIFRATASVSEAFRISPDDALAAFVRLYKEVKGTTEGGKS